MRNSRQYKILLKIIVKFYWNGSTTLTVRVLGIG